MTNSNVKPETALILAAPALAGFALVLALAAARAEPAVLADRAPTRPAEDYGIPRIALPQQPARPPTPLSTPGPAWPVRTPGLSPGAFAPYDARLPQLAGRPMFLIGSDTLSRDWLARHQARLAELHAAGLLVQAEGPGDLAAMRDLVGGLPLAAANARELARILNLSHYPALISAGRIEQ